MEAANSVGEHSIRDKEKDTASVVQSLIGAIPYTDLSLSEVREERLSKYEAAN